MKDASIRWERDVEDHDFESAEAYLSIRLDDDRAKELVRKLRHTKLTHRRANDILRACDREPLPLDDPGVLRGLLDIAKGGKLSPVLVVSFAHGGDIADGYHRVSLSYHLDPFSTVPLRIAAG